MDNTAIVFRQWQNQTLALEKRLKQIRSHTPNEQALLALNLQDSVLNFIAQVAEDYTQLMDIFVAEQDAYHQEKIEEMRLSSGKGEGGSGVVFYSIRNLTDVMAKQSKDYESRMSAETAAISQRLAKILCTLSNAYQVSLNPQVFKK